VPVHHDDRAQPSPAVTTAEELDALLRARPDAVVAALGMAGGLRAVPGSVPLHGQRAFVSGIGLELVVAEDQVLLLDAWTRAATEPIVHVEVHLLSDPDDVARISFFDVRDEHGVHVVVLDAHDPEQAWRSAELREARRRRVGRVERDDTSVFLAVDEGTTALLGWSAEELVGRRTLDLVHPDDVEQAIQAWMAMRAGTGTGRVRVRYRHKDGHHVWLEVTNDNRLDDPAVGRVLSELVDISEEMAQLEALRQREDLLARLSEALPIGLCHVRSDGRVMFTNEPWVALVGYVDGAEALVRSVAGPDRVNVDGALRAALRGQPTSIEVGVLDGYEERRCELTFRPLSDADGADDGVIVCAADVTDASRLRAELEHRASHDALSGCLNRAATVTALERALRLSSQVAVAYIDLDRFKAVNDELGHAAGDELLRVAAARLRSVVRIDDRVGRMGGDEFVVISPQGTGPFEAAALLERLTDAVNGDVAFARQRIPLRASIGVALSEPGELDAEAVLSRADAAMYDAKRRARAVDAPAARPASA
jgi:diguanylate cyclase (GGDEF)-like protein/PAS domain S-box-containing protein